MRSALPDNTFWIEPKILPHGGKLVIAAAQKTGKSFISLGLCEGLTQGGPIFGERSGITAPQPCRVLLVDAELGEHRLQENFRYVFGGVEGKIEDRLFYLSKEQDLFLDSPKGMAKLENFIRDVRPHIVILDPIGKFMDTWDENSNQHMNSLLNRLDKILAIGAEWGMAMIITHHTRKVSYDSKGVKVSNDLDPDSITGASKWKNYADSVLMIGHKEIRARNPQWWTLEGGWTLRHGPEPANIVLSVNKGDTRQVRYFGGGSSNAVAAAPVDILHRV